MDIFVSSPWTRLHPQHKLKCRHSLIPYPCTYPGSLLGGGVKVNVGVKVKVGVKVNVGVRG